MKIYLELSFQQLLEFPLYKLTQLLKLEHLEVLSKKIFRKLKVPTEMLHLHKE